MVKRVGNLYGLICSEENIREAWKEARRGKSKKPGVAMVDADPEPYLASVRDMLVNGTYRSGEYRMFPIRERGKERMVSDVDFYPHRIVHWAVMRVIRPYLMNRIGHHSYAAMEGRGSHQALTRMRRDLRADPEWTRYAFKMDVRRFFPSIDKDILMRKLERVFKDPELMALLREIVHGYPGTGLPIGNYTSQYLANFYLADLDRHMKQVYHCRCYYRYMDDIIVLGRTKAWLRRVRRRIDTLLQADGLTMKGNWQIFPVESRGIDFVGYRTFHSFTLLRRATKLRLKRACRRLLASLPLDVHGMCTVASYSGILGWCDSHRLRDRTLSLLARFIIRPADDRA